MTELRVTDQYDTICFDKTNINKIINGINFTDRSKNNTSM